MAGTSGVPQPNPLPKQGHPEQAAQHRGQGGWNISREGDSTTSLGSLGWGSVTLRGKKFFLGFSWSFLCLSLCPLPLVLLLGTTGKSLALKRAWQWRVGLGDPQRSLPTPTIPGFCEGRVLRSEAFALWVLGGDEQSAAESRSAPWRRVFAGCAARRAPVCRTEMQTCVSQLAPGAAFCNAALALSLQRQKLPARGLSCGEGVGAEQGGVTGRLKPLAAAPFAGRFCVCGNWG